MIDKLGKCPHCEEDWDGGDVYEQLNSIETFMHKSEIEMKVISNSLGHSPLNRNRFSKAISHEVTLNKIDEDDNPYTKTSVVIECPNMHCGHVFDVVTGEEYESMFHYRSGRKVENKTNNYFSSEIDENIRKYLIPADEATKKDIFKDVTKSIKISKEQVIDFLELEQKQIEDAKEKPKDNNRGDDAKQESRRAKRWGR